MPAPILATKLYVPPPRLKVVLRPRLIERLNDGLRLERGFGRKLTLISAPAGFGKTTIVSEWVAGCEQLVPKVRVAWLSLDEGDSDPTRFLTYVVAAFQTIAPTLGSGTLAALETPQPPPLEWILTALLNEIVGISDDCLLVLDDYHVIAGAQRASSTSADDALNFLLEHLPPHMHLVIATREDPQLPLARYRAGSQLNELRAADLRFTPAEAAEFLNQVMGLNLSAADIAALETRTEGWIAGLQMAALSMQGQKDTAGFIKSFTGSHHFVLDYLLEEVLEQQPANIQTFLLRTSILDRMCGPLCEAAANSSASGQEPAGQKTLEYLERANLFTVALDNERHWYRYHHLFGSLLRQRLGQNFTQGEIAELHICASQWYENNDLTSEAFHHAAAANDVERAERLVDEGRLPLHFPGAVTAVLDWLASLSRPLRDARPSLWVKSATLALVIGQTTGIDERLDAAEAALKGVEPDPKIQDLYGQIAEARATLALARYQVETAIAQARRALAYLHPNHLSFRSTTGWVLGTAYSLAGDRVAARQALTDALATGEAAGEDFSILLATIALGQVLESETQLHEAAETYRRAVQLAGDPALSIAFEAQLGLGRIAYEWNDLPAAQHHGEQSLELALQYDRALDQFIPCEVFLARLKLAHGDTGEAAAMLARTERSARERNFPYRLPEIVAWQVLALLRQGEVAAAAELAQAYDLPLSQGRVLLAQGDASGALAVLEPLRQQMEQRGWADERLKAMVLQAVALYAQGKKDRAVQVLGEALALAEPGAFIRLFLDEGDRMAQLLADIADRGPMARYAGKLLAAFRAVEGGSGGPLLSPAQPLIPGPRGSPRLAKPIVSTPRDPGGEPLSQRELEILQLIAQGLSNQEIGARLFLALDTVKGHNRVIFDKLQVQNRTAAVARARELSVL